MRMERPEAEILHRKKEGKREKKKTKIIEKPEPETELENRALTDSKQTAQRKRYHTPLHSFDTTG